jgi:hypothetical protein
MITCRSCNKTKYEDDFVVKNGRITNLCRECRRERDRVLYRQHRKCKTEELEENISGLSHRYTIQRYAEYIASKKFLRITEVYLGLAIIKKTLKFVGIYGINYLFEDEHGCKYSYNPVQLWSLKRYNEEKDEEYE